MIHDKKSRLTAAILAGGANGYDTASLLTNYDIKTYLLTPHKLRDGKYPRTKILLCPSPNERDELVRFINENVAPGHSVVLLPSSDEFALFLARHRTQIDKRFLYLQPDASLIEALDNKMLFYELCRKHGIPCPKSLIVKDKSEVESLPAEVLLPSVVKAFRSRDWPKSVGYKIQIVNTAEELRKVVMDVLPHGCQVVVQDLIPGGAETDWIVGGLYDQDSNPVKLYVGQKLLQHPLDVGPGCYVGLMWNQDAVDLANAFAKRTKYCGLIDLDMKFDWRDGKYKILEVNPRNGLCHRISHDGSWDILSFYVHWISGAKDSLGDYAVHKDGRKWIYPHEHLCSRIEQNGIYKGVILWCEDMRQTKLRCAWDMRDLYRDWRYGRILLGHVRRLGLRTLVFGRDGSSGTLESSSYVPSATDSMCSKERCSGRHRATLSA
jgi:predicted ATP-grasp superfamily ATP-dependent carboligase